MKTARTVLLIILSVGILLGCAQKQLFVRDLTDFPQDAGAYIGINRVIIPEDQQKVLADRYLALFFSPWTGFDKPLIKEKLQTRYDGILLASGLGENLRPLTPDSLRGLIENTNLSHFPSDEFKAVTVQTVNLRVLPTISPFFLEKCGTDGYPFDLFQDSSLWPGTPLKVRHYSRDRQWVFVQAGFVSGWMTANEFVRVDEKLVTDYLRLPKGVLIKDHVPIFSERDDFIAEGRIGMILPLSEGGALFPVATVGGAELQKVSFPEKSCVSFPLAMTRSYAARIINELEGQPYGWGGLYENRDCSSMLRDYFTVFGIWLPRNSSQQIQTGEVADMSNLSLGEKKVLIREEGIPFLHLVGKRGHVTLYVGIFNEEPVFFHNLWGVPFRNVFAQKSRRIIVGQSAFTGPHPGFENPEARNAGKSLLGKLNFLTNPARVE